jgi:hypothetical protein
VQWLAGPEGCNLFVFHIPNDMTNLDLYQMFSTFGQVRLIAADCDDVMKMRWSYGGLVWAGH